MRTHSIEVLADIEVGLGQTLGASETDVVEIGPTMRPVRSTVRALAAKRQITQHTRSYSQRRPRQNYYYLAWKSWMIRSFVDD